MISQSIFIALLIAFFVTMLITWLLYKLATHLGLVDHPSGRKQHQRITPLIGGIAMFGGFIFALLHLSISLQSYRLLIICAGFLMLIGILDDFHEISARRKLLFQIIVAVMVVWGGIRITNLGPIIIGSQQVVMMPTIVASLFSIIAIIGLINAVNMTDGIDGLAGGVSMIQFIFLLILAVMANRHTDTALLSLLIVVLTAFLLLNLPFYQRSALIFMGDAGSMFLGLSLAWFCIDLSQGSGAAAPPVVFLWIMAFSLFDMASVMLHRLWLRKSPFLPGRDHFHHALLALGLNVIQVNILIYAMTVMFAAIGVIGSLYWHLSSGLLFLLIVLLFIIYFIIYRFLLAAANANIT